MLDQVDQNFLESYLIPDKLLWKLLLFLPSRSCFSWVWREQQLPRRRRSRRTTHGSELYLRVLHVRLRAEHGYKKFERAPWREYLLPHHELALFNQL